MNFVHPRNPSDRTIAAIASAIGEGGVAVLRISGPKALSISQKILKSNLLEISSNTVKFTQVVDFEGHIIDEVLCFWMKGPKTFTGEDVVEIHSHGGMIIPQKILSLLVKAGASLAEPGEFTQRAYIHGKIDLAQAEAIQEMIHAKSEFVYRSAKNHLLGKLSEKISDYQRRLTDIAAILEAWVDYPEEGLEFASEEEILAELDSIYRDMELLLLTFHDGQKLSEGLRLCILGLPNVGKSSLLNALLGKNRAIVTPVAGTTRDVIEEELVIDDLCLRLIDTAGIRSTNEIVEQEGIKRSYEKAAEADLILFVTEGFRSLLPEEKFLLTSLPAHKVLIIRNKVDEGNLETSLSSPFVPLSAKTHEGLEALKEKIKEKAFSDQNIRSAEVFITKERHRASLDEALSSLRNCIRGLQQSISPEFITLDIRECLYHLGRIIGRNISEDILDAIFSKFCVGK